MNPNRLQASAALGDVLGQENAALKRLDFAAAAALLPAKESAIANLAACAGNEPAEAAPPPSPEDLSAARHLAALAAENRALLERAITVQTRVIGIIASAARQQTAPSYAADGRRGPAARTGAVTLSAQA